MKILLTGACGTVARAIRALGASEHQFVLTDVLEAVADDGGHVCSITDAEELKRISVGCDAIIHTAAIQGAWYGKATNAQFIEINLLGAEHLFQAAIANGIPRLVISSSMEVLCGRDWAAQGKTVYDEDTPPNPDWIYPVTKLLVEQLSEFYASRMDLEVVNLRYAGVVQNPTDPGRIVKYLARGVADSDVAKANLLAATTPGLKCEVLNIAIDTPLTEQDILDGETDPWQVVERHWPGCRPYLESAGISDIVHKHFWPVPRIDRAKRVLNWKPEITFTTMLQQMGWEPRESVLQSARR